MAQQEILQRALDLMFETHYKEEQIGTLQSEIKELQRESRILWEESPAAIDNTIFYDKESGQLFLVERSKTGYILFTTVKPANFTTDCIVDETDEEEER